MSDELPEPVRLSFDKPPTKAELRAASGQEARPKKPLRDRIPVPPKMEVDPDALTKPDIRAKATVNLKLAGASFVDIAEELGYASARDAETAYVSALANMHPVSSWETLRQTAAARAEMQLQRSAAMASATHLVDADDPTTKIANTDQLRWHEQFGKDLALWVAITGAKAPARVEISADSAMLTQMAEAILAGSGGPAEIEASVWDMDDVEDAMEITEEP